jgi:hypothetical protein
MATPSGKRRWYWQRAGTTTKGFVEPVTSVQLTDDSKFVLFNDLIKGLGGPTA